MSENQNPTVQAVQDSVVNLIELVEQAARGETNEDSQSLCEEAMSTALMLIAAIVLSDKKYEAGEQSFLRVLVNWQEKAGGEMGYLGEYEERWKKAAMQVPRFFQTAVRHDGRRGTEIARAMLREIQLIGNNTCVSDGSFDAAEHSLVRNYILLLEEFMLAWRQLPQASKNTPVEGWTSI